MNAGSGTHLHRRKETEAGPSRNGPLKPRKRQQMDRKQQEALLKIVLMKEKVRTHVFNLSSFSSASTWSVVQLIGRVWLCDPMDCSIPGLPAHHQPPESTQTHVHWVGDAIQPSHPLLSPSPSALNLFQHQGLFQWVSSSHQVAKGLELQRQSSQWIFRVDLFWDCSIGRCLFKTFDLKSNYSVSNGKSAVTWSDPSSYILSGASLWVERDEQQKKSYELQGMLTPQTPTANTVLGNTNTEFQWKEQRRRWCLLSPLLFKVAVETFSREWNKTNSVVWTLSVNDRFFFFSWQYNHIHGKFSLIHRNKHWSSY